MNARKFKFGAVCFGPASSLLGPKMAHSFLLQRYLSLSLSLFSLGTERRRHGFISSMGSSSDTSGGDKEKGSEPSFKEGDRVLAYHGPLLYEAKVGCPLSPPSIPSPKS
jgi:hypothetical protein